MTRINVGIDPKELPTKLLLAEHRELKRIPNNVRENKANLSNIPPRFTLGTGHVKFFYNKLGYLKNRYLNIYSECVYRNCNVQYYGDAFNGIPLYLMQDYSPTPADRELLVQRIHTRGFQLLSECVTHSIAS